jgi:isoleucyl-tRNA synthetase
MDALNNWYIRRSRDRFWREEKDADKQGAYDTLYTVLNNLCRVAAPFLPFVTEKIYRGLTGEKSVHLADWPDAKKLPASAGLVEIMDRVREICSATLSIREKENLRVRLPLRSLIVVDNEIDQLRFYQDIIKEELNIKHLIFSNLADYNGTFELKVNPAIGKRVGAKMKEIMPAAKKGEWTDNGDGTITIAGETLSGDDFSMQLVTAEGQSSQQLAGQGAVILDTVVTPELEREGLARDLVRLVQQTRKDADFHISDRIELSLELPENIKQAVEEHAEIIKAETLASTLILGSSETADYTGEHELAGEKIIIAVKKLREAA